MINDDESFLSAYMDGQLDFDQQQRVEAALAASPHLTERLRGLTLVRDMVASLPQDGSVDISSRVIQQIQARRRHRGFLPTLEGWRHGSRRILPLAGLAATAATLMVAASLAILVQTSQLDRGERPVALLPHGEIVVPRDPPVIPVVVDARTKSSAPEAPASSSHTEISGALANRIVPARTAAPDPSQRPVAEASELSSSGGLEPLRQFLDNPSLKRFFLVQSGPKNDSEQMVATVVEHSTHLDFFKITVSQGIVIDPRHPDQATVFAFVLNPNQVDLFHEQLKVALPGLVEKQPLDPAVATQLADIGKVQALSPASLAKVEIPREALALRTKASNASETASGIDTPRPLDRAAVVSPPAEPDNRVVVLVWVAKPPAK